MKTTRVYVAAACVILICLATGFLAGWFLSRTTQDNSEIQRNGHTTAKSSSPPDWARDLDPEITKKFMDEISANKIEQNLRYTIAFIFFLNFAGQMKSMKNVKRDTNWTLLYLIDRNA